MHCISDSACSKLCSNLIGDLLPLLNSVLGNKLDSSAHIGLQELRSFCILLASNLEEPLCSGRSELAHLQTRDRKAVLIYIVNYLASVDVYIGFDKCECGFLVSGKVVAGESIAVVYEL